MKSGIVQRDKNSPWVKDDVEWFKKHPDRKYRARSTFLGELKAMGMQKPSRPYQAIVKRPEPNELPTQVMSARPFPDDEKLLEALFDVLSHYTAYDTPAALMAAIRRKMTGTHYAV
jgi:hypothetical protein